MSLLPPRCFACNKPLNHLDDYIKMTGKGISIDAVLDTLGYRRMCCRSHYITYPIELENNLKSYDPSMVSGNARSEMRKM